MVADGMTTDEILAEHPDLTAEDIHESLLYGTSRQMPEINDDVRPDVLRSSVIVMS